MPNQGLWTIRVPQTLRAWQHQFQSCKIPATSWERRHLFEAICEFLQLVNLSCLILLEAEGARGPTRL